MNQFPITQVVHRSVYHEHHIYSLLSAISIRLKGIFGREINGQSPAMYRANASHHLRQELVRNSESGSIDKHTLLDILFLCVSEIAHGEYESAHEHLTVVGKLYHILDTREHFDFWISETAAHVDNQLALSTGGRPVLPFDFDPGPMLPERMAALKRELKSMLDQEVADSYRLPNPRSLTISSPPRGLKDAIADLAASLDLRMGSHFEWGLKIGIFNVQMGRVVRDLVDCVAIAKVVWLSPHAVCFDAEWLCRKARAVMRSLLALAPENNIGPQDLVGKCMESARLALLIMMSHACTMIGFQTAQANVKRLQKAMAFAFEFWCPVVGLTLECAKFDDRTLDPFVMIQLQFILFSLMTGLWSASECPSLEQWFLVRAVNVCRIVGIRNFFELQEHLVFFLYAKTMQEASVRKVALHLEQG
jgi:Fungal specific transcription factor domain